MLTWMPLLSGSWPFAHRDLVDQRDAPVPEAGVVRLPYDRDVTDGIGTGRGDKAGTFWFRVIGQVPSRLGLAVTDQLSEEPDCRLGITLVDELDGNGVRSHPTTLAYANDVLSWRYLRGGPSLSARRAGPLLTPLARTRLRGLIPRHCAR